MKKIIILSLALVGIFGASCANEGTLSTAPQFAKLIMQVAPVNLTTTSAASLMSMSDDFTGQIGTLATSIPTEVYGFFKECPDTTPANCTEAMPATSDAYKCTSSQNGVYPGMSGTSALSAACFVDHNFAMASGEITKCKYSAGKALNISTWINATILTAWGVPTTMNFQGVASSGKLSDDEAFKYFRVKPDATGDKGQWVFTPEGQSGMLGYKDNTNNQFGFIWAMYKGGTPGLTAVFGNVTTNAFEAYRTEGTATRRIKSDGTYVYSQVWNTYNLTSSSVPTSTGCYKLSDRTVAAGALCVTAFSLTTIGANNDAAFKLKVVDVPATIGADGIAGKFSMVTNAPDPMLMGCF